MSAGGEGALLVMAVVGLATTAAAFAGGYAAGISDASEHLPPLPPPGVELVLCSATMDRAEQVLDSVGSWILMANPNTMTISTEVE